jgi:hypothetical protein
MMDKLLTNIFTRTLMLPYIRILFFATYVYRKIYKYGDDKVNIFAVVLSMIGSRYTLMGG